jgi:hypothetical protein
MFDVMFHGIGINSTICEAIKYRVRLRCEYGDDEEIRIIEPQCHGITNKLSEVVRIIEIYPGDQAGEPIEGKLFTVSKMGDLKKTEEKFLKPGRHYNPKDKAMKYVHCHL